MTSIWETAGQVWQNLSGLLRNRRDTTPIDSVAALTNFLATRSAYVAQKTLYGYVKARMGIRYPLMFEDKQLILSLNIAKLNVFAACLSDLTIFAVAAVLHDRPVGNDQRQALARRCYDAALQENIAGAPEQFSAQACIDDFSRRLGETDWRAVARQPDNFTNSPQALVKWAPIADELKKYDTEIIENSVKFGWNDIREQWQKRVVADAVYADWLRQSNPPRQSDPV
jgi:hypothetical protein